MFFKTRTGPAGRPGTRPTGAWDRSGWRPKPAWESARPDPDETRSIFFFPVIKRRRLMTSED